MIHDYDQGFNFNATFKSDGKDRTYLDGTTALGALIKACQTIAAEYDLTIVKLGNDFYMKEKPAPVASPTKDTGKK